MTETTVSLALLETEGDVIKLELDTKSGAVTQNARDKVLTTKERRARAVTLVELNTVKV